MLRKDLSSLCPLCGTQTKQCLLMPIKEAVDFPVAELKTNMKKTLDFFQEDSSQTLRALSSQQSGFDMSVCIACVHLLNSCVLFCTRKIQNGVFQSSSNSRKESSPEQEAPKIPQYPIFESKKSQKPIEIVLPQEKEPESPILFVNPSPNLSTNHKSSPICKPRSNIGSESPNRISSTSPEANILKNHGKPDSIEYKNATATSAVVQSAKAIISPNPKPNATSDNPIKAIGNATITSSKSLESSAGESVICSKSVYSIPQAKALRSLSKLKDSIAQASAPSSKLKSTYSSAQTSVSSSNFVNSTSSPKSKDISSQTACSKSIAKSTESSECSKVSKENPWGEKVAANQPILNKLSSSGDQKQQLFMNMLDLCKQTTPGPSDSEQATNTTIVNQFDILKATSSSSSPGSEMSPRSKSGGNIRPSTRKCSLSSNNSPSRSLHQENLCKNVTTNFDTVVEPSKEMKSRIVTGAPSLSLLERVAKATQQKTCMHSSVIKPSKKLFSFTRKTIPKPENDGNIALSTHTSLPNSDRVSHFQPSNQPTESQQIIQKEEPQAMDFTSKPIKFSRSPSMKQNLPDLHMIKSANLTTSQSLKKQNKNETETESLILKSILKKTKPFTFGTKKTAPKNVRFSVDSCLRFFETDEALQGLDGTDRIHSDRDEFFCATFSVKSDLSSLQLNLSSEPSSNIFFNLERKTKFNDVKTSPTNGNSTSVGESACKDQDISSSNMESLRKKRVREENNSDFTNKDKILGTPDSTVKIDSTRSSDLKKTCELTKCKLNKRSHPSDVQPSPKKARISESSMGSEKSNIEVITPESDELKSANDKKTSPELNKDLSSKLCNIVTSTTDLEKTEDKKLQKPVCSEANSNNMGSNTLDNNAASEIFLKKIGLIDNDDFVTSQEAVDLSTAIENDDLSQATSTTLSNIEPVPSASVTPVEIVKRKPGRPASKKIKPSTNNISDIENKPTDNEVKSKTKKKGKGRKAWKAKYIADQVVENDSEVTNEELINAQRRMMSCFVQLTRCDEKPDQRGATSNSSSTGNPSAGTTVPEVCKTTT